MPRDGSGNYSLPYDWEADRDNNIKIRADRMMAQQEDIGTALTGSMPRDGQAAATGVQNMGGFRVSNVGSATSATDALNRQTADGRYSQRPGSTTDNQLVRFDGTSGTLQGTGITVNDSDQVSGAKSGGADYTGTSNSMVAADIGCAVTVSNGSANTFSLLAAATAGRCTVLVVQTGAGQTTVDVSGGGTLNAPNGAKISQQHGMATCFCNGTAWWIGGDVTS
ncbi:hypothetical protein ACFOGJ_16240 [Marinibaculum pumilum]|uniref:Uncharacterized protein n=1 Tax=Marinibaculum pumilum TaxID=1766165 RepID=A0ABV7L323_9PROT